MAPTREQYQVFFRDLAEKFDFSSKTCDAVLHPEITCIASTFLLNASGKASLTLSIHFMQSHLDNFNDRSCNNFHVRRQLSNSCLNVKVVLDGLPLAVKRNVLAIQYIHATSGRDTVYHSSLALKNRTFQPNL